MLRTVTFILLLGLMVTTHLWQAAALAQNHATPPTDASSSPEASLDVVLPGLEHVPDGMVIISDGERTLDDVASGFEDPVATIEQFVAWGWQGNAIRAFHIDDESRADPLEIDGIYISVHQFGSPEFAAEALDLSVTEHLLDPAIDEVAGPKFGDSARTLVGEMPYGTEITFYVQEGPLLIRLSASSPEGDPTAEATRLMQAMLSAQTATPVAS